MAALDVVREFIEVRSGEAICDNCITLALDLRRRQHASQLARKLLDEPGFERRAEYCPECGKLRLVTRYA